jgi:taurine dioxygenase
MGAVESAAVAASSASKLRFMPIPGAPFGVEVNGIAWGRPDAETVRLLTMALRRHLLILFRGQPSPSENELDEFFRGFGRLVLDTEDGSFHYKKHLDRTGPASELMKENRHNIHRSADNTGSTYYQPSEYGASELIWHTDQAHKPQLKLISCLEAMDFEPNAVPTQFRDMYTAYEMLPREWRSELEFRQLAFYDPRLPGPAEQPRLSDSQHPLFIQHPQTGRRSIFANDSVDRIIGLDRTDSDQWLARLFEHANLNAPHYTHHWTSGDLVIWDNIGLHHRRDAVPPNQRRHLRQHGGISET